MKIPIAALAAILASTAAAQTFQVSGTVVDSESGAPLSRTRVVLTGGPVGELSVITSGNGTFSFGVPRGKYTLMAAHRDWGESYGQSVPSRAMGSAIITGPDQDTTRIVFRWHAPGAIRGKVVDESGEPVHSAAVELFVEAVAGGKKRLASMGRAESDELGNYFWSSLPAGTYYLAATGEPWYSSDAFAMDQLTEAGRPPARHALTYFPGTNDARAATPLTLRPGAELQADFVLRPVAGANLRFACPDSPCAGSLSLYAVGLGGAETLVKTTDAPATDVIEAVLPGRYVVRYTGVEGAMRKVIDVGGGDVTVEIAPKPVPTLAGEVTFRNPADRPRHTVYVNLLDEDTGRSFAVALRPDGGFSWPTVAASRVRLLLRGADGFFIAQMSVDGASVKDGVIEVVDGARVQVNLAASSETGRLKGFARNGDKPLPGVLVVLAPSAGATDPLRYLGFQTESDGSFDYTTVPAGDYVLFAVDNLDLEYANPEVVRPYRASGKRVRIEPHGVQTESIELAPAARN